jgi:hypothetical protein
VALLRDVRAAQQLITQMAVHGPNTERGSAAPADVSAFLDSLATAWKEGEVRPTHRRKPAVARWWRTRPDPFQHAWPVIQAWLIEEPTATAKELMERLAEMIPDAYASKAQLRTLQRRIKVWRAEKARDLILGRIRKAATLPETSSIDGEAREP